MTDPTIHELLDRLEEKVQAVYSGRYRSLGDYLKPGMVIPADKLDAVIHYQDEMRRG